MAGGGLTLAGVVVAPTVSPALRVSAGHVTLDDAAVVARAGSRWRSCCRAA
ncbi:MAG: hypothetical protein H6730_25080 [Deltaproteobacteria bacterium]|nr:hypothetical protein [Deltaproteobacteria bacterium]